MPSHFSRTLRSEFRGYDAGVFRQDALAGLTVAAVALPLALAFGVASGATAQAGMVTAVIAGLVIGGLAGAPYQISGPTGAMSAVLIGLAGRYGLEGIWMAGLMAGLLLTALGVLRLGRAIAFIPAPVVTGFTSGIAVIIAVGQLPNVLGIVVPPAESVVGGLRELAAGGFAPDARAVLLAVGVMALMLAWPSAWNLRLPASLLGIVLATAVAVGLGWDVPSIGAIPRSIVLSERLNLAALPWERWREFLAPALTITALGAVESLLCGAVASNMTGIRLRANQELIAQGLGNALIPFFGGVPATAAIARTSVGIRAGGQTRMVSIVHALVLLASVFALAPIMSRIPRAALGGVLVVTAWRMNEWHAIGYIFGRRFKAATAAFLATLAATVMLDLTQAILIGAVVSGAVFLNQIARIDIEVRDVDVERARERGVVLQDGLEGVRVAYLTGPLFFAATDRFHESTADLSGVETLILSMRGVPHIDTSGLLALIALHDRLRAQGGTLMLAGLHGLVRRMLERGGVLAAVGEGNVFWGAEEAIAAADARRAPTTA